MGVSFLPKTFDGADDVCNWFKSEHSMVAIVVVAIVFSIARCAEYHGLHHFVDGIDDVSLEGDYRLGPVVIIQATCVRKYTLLAIAWLAAFTTFRLSKSSRGSRVARSWALTPSVFAVDEVGRTAADSIDNLSDGAE